MYVLRVKYIAVIPGHDMGMIWAVDARVLAWFWVFPAQVMWTWIVVSWNVCASLFLGCRPETQLVSRVCECKLCTCDSQDLVQVYTPTGSICSSNSFTS